MPSMPPANAVLGATASAQPLAAMANHRRFILNAPFESFESIAADPSGESERSSSWIPLHLDRAIRCLDSLERELTGAVWKQDEGRRQERLASEPQTAPCPRGSQHQEPGSCDEDHEPDARPSACRGGIRNALCRLRARRCAAWPRGQAPRRFERAGGRTAERGWGTASAGGWGTGARRDARRSRADLAKRIRQLSHTVVDRAADTAGRSCEERCRRREERCRRR